MCKQPGHRRFAAFWDWMSRHEPGREKHLRREVTAGVHGRTLEIGYGVGSNWEFLPQEVDYTGIEPDPYMRQRAVAHLPHGKDLTAVDGDAQALGFPDESFDTVFATLVFCTVPDAQRGLREAFRVLRPGGEFRFWEHVRAHGKVAAGLQDAVTPVWKRLGGGCHPNRDTLAAIKAAGFEVQSVRRMKIGPVPAIVGVARRPASTPREQTS